MSIINFQDAIRARLSQMADEHYAMQEAMLDLPRHEVEAHCARMTAHSAEMSKLASRLADADSRLSESENLESTDDGPEAA